MEVEETIQAFVKEKLKRFELNTAHYARLKAEWENALEKKKLHFEAEGQETSLAVHSAIDEFSAERRKKPSRLRLYSLLITVIIGTVYFIGLIYSVIIAGNGFPYGWTIVLLLHSTLLVLAMMNMSFLASYRKSSIIVMIFLAIISFISMGTFPDVTSIFYLPVLVLGGLYVLLLCFQITIGDIFEPTSKTGNDRSRGGRAAIMIARVVSGLLLLAAFYFTAYGMLVFAGYIPVPLIVIFVILAGVWTLGFFLGRHPSQWYLLGVGLHTLFFICFFSVALFPYIGSMLWS
ncbi:hypothetical protein [Aureibacillus halotolerans]|uniref:Uncharacterized protein n=1 Tax=Aureibacillus halotolerans TaxID=1508390 RepID=A0A4R6TPH9_9BACI|nr:hypothetical protein [Aureibacillus halotolerans]TDQ32167.1 hypothetical protein EV213_13213 [Aureibacillus halotolerans]